MSETALFIHLLKEEDKASSMKSATVCYRSGGTDARLYEIVPEGFLSVAGAPFSYWVSSGVRSMFRDNPQLEADGREVQSGASTMNDFRFLRKNSFSVS